MDAGRVRRSGSMLLAAELPDGDPIGLFERASAQDSLGYEANAAAVCTGRRLPVASPAFAAAARPSSLQARCAISGRSTRALPCWRPSSTMPSDELDDAVLGFLALSLVDAGRAAGGRAGLALGRLARHLPRYNRSLKRYADALLPDA
ncbi:tetratricopeptide repeat protein [Ensifer canadensis]